MVPECQRLIRRCREPVGQEMREISNEGGRFSPSDLILDKGASKAPIPSGSYWRRAKRGLLGAQVNFRVSFCTGHRGTTRGKRVGAAMKRGRSPPASQGNRRTFISDRKHRRSPRNTSATDYIPKITLINETFVNRGRLIWGLISWLRRFEQLLRPPRVSLSAVEARRPSNRVVPPDYLSHA